MATRNRLKGEDADFLDSDVIGLVKSGEHSPVAETARDSKTTISIEVPAVSYSTGHHGTNSPVYHRGRGTGFRSRFSLNRRPMDEDEKKPRRSFCRSWCEMWFLLARSKVTCVGLSAVLFGGGIMLILLTAFGGLTECPTLHGAVVFCYLMGTLSLSLGFLCCCYHWVKDDEDLPFAIFCVAYCLLLLFIYTTLAGTVVVFTRIHPLGPDQPPPGVPLPNKNLTSVAATAAAQGELAAAAGKDCSMVELPLGVLIICFILSMVFPLFSYFACILALGATSDIPPL